jgi:hypothetical protein
MSASSPFMAKVISSEVGIHYHRCLEPHLAGVAVVERSGWRDWSGSNTGWYARYESIEGSRSMRLVVDEADVFRRCRWGVWSLQVKHTKGEGDAECN